MLSPTFVDTHLMTVNDNLSNEIFLIDQNIRRYINSIIYLQLINELNNKLKIGKIMMKTLLT